MRTITAVLLAAAISAQPQARVVDDAAVLGAILERQCAKDSGEYYVLASETHALADLERAGVPRNVAGRDLLMRNRAPASLPPLLECPGIRLATEEAIAAVLAEHPPDPDPLHVGWEGFYARFKNAQGIRRLSLPGYSRDGKTALVMSSGAAGPLFGSVFVITLRKTAGRWVIVSSRSVGIS